MYTFIPLLITEVKHKLDTIFYKVSVYNIIVDGPNLIGLTGAIIAGSAYAPQIGHLIKERCSAGVSRSAFALWFIASVLITINAIYIEATVFIILGAIQTASTAIIFICSTKYKGQVCPFHQLHPENK